MKDLEVCLSQKYKELLNQMRGERRNQAFSNYDRFPRLNKYELEALEYNKGNFSLIDVHDKIYTKVKQYPPISKQTNRTDNFLRPELVKEVEALNKEK